MTQNNRKSKDQTIEEKNKSLSDRRTYKVENGGGHVVDFWVETVTITLNLSKLTFSEKKVSEEYIYPKNRFMKNHFQKHSLKISLYGKNYFKKFAKKQSLEGLLLSVARSSETLTNTSKTTGNFRTFYWLKQRKHFLLAQNWR